MDYYKRKKIKKRFIQYKLLIKRNDLFLNFDGLGSYIYAYSCDGEFISYKEIYLFLLNEALNKRKHNN